jgi:hypothetical protein
VALSRCGSPLAEFSVGSPPAQLSASLRIVHFVSALRVCGQAPSRLYFVAKGKSLNIACYAMLPRIMLRAEETLSLTRFLYTFQSLPRWSNHARRTNNHSTPSAFATFPNASYLKPNFGITVALQSQQRSRLKSVARCLND